MLYNAQRHTQTHTTPHARVITYPSDFSRLSIDAGQSQSHGEFSTLSGMTAAHTGMALRISSALRYRDGDGVGKFLSASSGRFSDFPAAAQFQPAF
jgi:hypothetical protein